jgi:hypothetical protein
MLSIAAGVLYGLILRAAAGSSENQLIVVMSLAYLFVGPFAIGYIAVALLRRSANQPEVGWLNAIFSPCFVILVSTLLAGLFRFEGLICLVMFLPVGFVLSALGGITRCERLQSAASPN